MSILSPQHPGFFEVLSTPRAYTALLYGLGSLVTGILGFVFVVTGLSLSLGLAIVIIGLPLLLAFLAGTRLLAVAEAHLLRVLVTQEDSPAAPPLVPAGPGFGARLKALVADRRTWTSQLYFLLRLPLGIASFTTLLILLCLGLAFTAVPVAYLLLGSGAFSGDCGGIALDSATQLSLHPGLTAALLGLVGLVLLPLTLHLALLLGRFQVWLAKHLLVCA